MQRTSNPTDGLTVLIVYIFQQRIEGIKKKSNRHKNTVLPAVLVNVSFVHGPSSQGETGSEQIPEGLHGADQSKLVRRGGYWEVGGLAVNRAQGLNGSEACCRGHTFWYHPEIKPFFSGYNN